MNQLKSTDTIVVTGGVGRVKNPYLKYPYAFNKASTDGTVFASQEWKAFDQTAIDNQFHTDAKDGDYLFSEFGDEVWQYQKRGNMEWETEKIQQVYVDMNFKEYANIMYDEHDCATRPFRSLTQPKPVEQPEVKETVEELAEKYIRGDKELSNEKEHLIALHHYKAGFKDSDQRHAAEREVLVKRVQDLEDVLNYIYKKTLSGYAANKPVIQHSITEALNQKA